MLKNIFNLKLYETKIIHSKLVAGFKYKYPRLFRFIIERFTLKKFNGLPLTFFSIAVFFNLLLLFDFTQDVINSKEFIVVDNFISELLYSIRYEPLSKLFYLFSKLCDIKTVAVLGAMTGIYALLKKNYNLLIGVLISILGSAFTIYLGKYVFKINRPTEFSYYLENYFSFPSGHATIAVSFYGLLFYLFIRNSSSLKKKAQFTLSAFIFIFLIGLSRLYLGVHYFSDVIAGYILGFLWLLVSVGTIEWMKYK